MRKKNRLVYGIGVNDFDGEVRTNGKTIKSYKCWSGILERCYSEKTRKKNLAYKGCAVSEEWLHFSNFKNWYDENFRHDLHEQGIKVEIDKDLLSKNNKIYSAETCVFIPRKVNLFLANKCSNNTSGNTGVSWMKPNKKWRVCIQSNGKNKYMGLFVSFEQAKKAYENAREIEVVKIKEYLTKLGYSENIIDKIR